MSVADVAEQVSRALAAVAAARQALAHADAELTEARDIWAALFQGSNDPETAELPAMAHHCLERVGELHGQLQRSEDVLRAYLDSIGATEARPASTTPTTSAEPPRPMSSPVERARAALPPLVKPGTGVKTRGMWWTDDDGDMSELVSGRDETSKRVDELLRERGLRVRVTRAKDVELKLAARMIDNGVTDASVVINNRPCTGALSCDSLLPVLLPPGSTLTVYGTEQDGSPFVKTYHGGGQ